jgi:hypothetical protein
MSNKKLVEGLNTKGIVLTSPEDFIKVILPQHYINLATSIGTMQEEQSKSMNLKDNSIDRDRKKSLDRTIESKKAEFAVKVWGGDTAAVTEPGQFHDVPDVGQVNVRHVNDKEDSLMIMKRDQDKVPLVLVYGSGNEFYLMGWTIPIYARNVIYKCNFRDEDSMFGFIHNMQPHESCVYPKQWLTPMKYLNKDLLK